MPINQPTTVIQRPFNNNNVNIGGAITQGVLAPFAGALGEMAGQGVKNLFGITTPAEEFTRAQAGLMTAGSTAKADAAWQQLMASPDGQNYAQNTDYKRQVGVSQGLHGEALEAWVETGRGGDPVLNEQMRTLGTAAQAQMRNDQMPTPFGQGPAPDTGKPPVPQSQQPPAAPPPPQAEQFGQAVAGARQENELKVEETRKPPESPSDPKVTVEAAPAGGLPQAVPGGAEPPPAESFNREKFSQELQAFTLRQGGYASLYRQMAQAALTGQMSAEQVVLAGSMANMRRADLTQLLNSAAPALNLDTKDKDGNPIGGEALEWGIAHINLQAMKSEALEEFRTKHKDAYADMVHASNNWKNLLRRVTFSQGEKLGDAVQKLAKGRVASPEANMTGYATDRRLAEEKRQYDMNYNLTKERQGAELSFEAERLRLAGNMNEVQTGMAKQQLELLAKYGGPEAEMRLKKAQSEIATDDARLQLALAQPAKDELTARTALYTAAVDAEEKRGIAFYNAQQKREAAMQNNIMKYEQELTKMADDRKTELIAWNSMKKKSYESVTEAQLNSWFKQNGGDPGGSRLDRFDAWFAAQKGNEGYRDYYTRVQEVKGTISAERTRLDELLSQQAPEYKDGVRDLAAAAMRQDLQKNLYEANRRRAKALFKESGMSALDMDSTLVNSLVGDYRFDTASSTYAPVSIWSTEDSKRLFAMAQGSQQGAVSAAALGATKVQGRTLQEIYGDRWPEFYNSYAKLVHEVK